LYGNGRADDAARKFCEVWDRDRSETLALTFAAKIYDGLSADMADQVRSRLARFVKNDRSNAVIIYYYATALWREHQQNPEAVPIAEIGSLLTTAAALQPGYADVFLQLGNVYAQQQKYAEAVRQYEKALRLAPDVATTHYRLGQVLARMGNSPRARQELATYERLRKQEAADTDKQRSEIQQFVYTIRSAGETAAKPNP
jgi:tetratricopeptide (TPR) repeat protein